VSTDPLVAAPYRRSVSPAERAWLVADRLAPPFCTQLILEGEGRPDIERWREATERAAAANPSSRVRLRGALGFCRWVDSGIAPPVIEVDAPGWDARSGDGAAFMSRPLDVREGPTTELIIVRGNVDRGEPDRVVLRCHHATTDGRGAVRLATEIGRALRDEPLEGSPSTVTDLELARSRGTKRGFPLEDAAAPTGLHRGTARAIVWKRRSIAGHPPQFLARMAVAVTQHIRTTADAPDPTVRLDIPVDLRRHDPSVRSTGNLTGIMSLEVIGEPSVESISAQIQSGLAEGREADSLVAAAGLVWVPLWLATHVARGRTRACNAASRYGGSAVLSNLGLLDVAAMSGPDFRVHRATMVPPGGHATPLFVLCAGHPSGIELAASMPEPLANGGRFDALMDAIVGAFE